ncbi:hypothetical protein HKX48_008731 [Thoreauomyces humboldtii]|nr:hypothetical protein HKX48_008731 [Thoreauomyces humboldtii]
MVHMRPEYGPNASKTMGARRRMTFYALTAIVGLTLLSFSFSQNSVERSISSNSSSSSSAPIPPAVSSTHADNSNVPSSGAKVAAVAKVVAAPPPPPPRPAPPCLGPCPYPPKYSKEEIALQKPDVYEKYAIFESPPAEAFMAPPGMQPRESVKPKVQVGPLVPKYFYERHSHYDIRYFKTRHSPIDPRRTVQIRDMFRAWATFADSNEIMYWINHGSMLGWFFGERVMPWDDDIDIQMNSNTLYELARFNMTTFTYGETTYLIDVNPNHVKRFWERHNVIDARFIDMSSGLFIDITGLAYSGQDQARGGVPTVRCKSPHTYTLPSIFPLHRVTYEGVGTWRPNSVVSILRKEYGVHVLNKLNFKGHTFKPELAQWIANPPPQNASPPPPKPPVKLPAAPEPQAPVQAPPSSAPAPPSSPPVAKEVEKKPAAVPSSAPAEQSQLKAQT